MRSGILAAVLAASLAATAAGQVKTAPASRGAGSGVSPVSGLPSGAGTTAAGAPVVAPLKLYLGSGLGVFAAPGIRLDAAEASRLAAPIAVDATVPVLGGAAVSAAGPAAPDGREEAVPSAPSAEVLPEAALPAARELDESRKSREGSDGIVARLKRLFDGAKPVKPDDGSAVAAAEGSSAAESYLSRAPQLPLKELGPRWRKTGGPQEAEAAFQDAKGPESIGVAQAGIRVGEKFKLEEAPAASRSQAGPAGSGTLDWDWEVWEMPDAVRQAALRGTAANEFLYWSDAKGGLFRQDFNSGRSFRVPVPSGGVDRFALSRSRRYLYAAAGAVLDRLDLNWDNSATLYDERARAGETLSLEQFVDGGNGDGILARLERGGTLIWQAEGIALRHESSSGWEAQQGLERVGNDLYARRDADGTRLWRRSRSGSGVSFDDLGQLPAKVLAVEEGLGPGVYLAVSADGLIEWNAASRTFRLFTVPGLKEAVDGVPVSLSVSEDGRRAAVAAGSRLFRFNLGRAREELDSKSASIRLWSQANPMFVEGGYLHIGDFKFPIARKQPLPRPWMERAWASVRRLLRMEAPPAAALEAGISERD
ncbi:MAG: hypothetical protein HZB91_05960, partial [Elusimicrobia bacterium]|nr:hypothetical protein [Elusimicrobiota bacterium]